MKLIFFNLGRKGGCLRYAEKLIDNLTVNKIVFSSLYSIEQSPENSIKIPTYKGKLSFLFSSIVVLPFFLTFLSAYCIDQKFFKKEKNLIFFFPYFHYWSVPIIWTAHLFKIKTISVVHDGVLHFGDGKPFEQKLNEIYIKKSDALIFLTDFVQKNVREKIGFTSINTVIPHGIIGNELFDFPQERLNRLKINVQPNLLFFGRVSKYKGVELLLKSLLKIDKSLFNKLQIVGKHQFDYKVPKTLQDKVHIIDEYVSERQMVDFFNESDILILPYIEATQSGVAMLGLAARIPMLISNVGGLSEQFDNEVVVYFEPSVNELSKKLNLILSSHSVDKRIEIIYRLNTQVEILSWNNIAKEVKKYIVALCSQQR